MYVGCSPVLLSRSRACSTSHADISRSYHALEVARGPAVTSVNNSLPPPTPRAAESSIWTTDLQAAPHMQLIPVWTNPNGSLFFPTLLHFDSVVSMGTGDFALGNHASSLLGPPSRSESEVVRVRVVTRRVHDTDSLTFGHKSQMFTFVPI